MCTCSQFCFGRGARGGGVGVLFNKTQTHAHGAHCFHDNKWSRYALSTVKGHAHTHIYTCSEKKKKDCTKVFF